MAMRVDGHCGKILKYETLPAQVVQQGRLRIQQSSQADNHKTVLSILKYAKYWKTGQLLAT
jgi:hypothetical protein